MKLQIMSLKIQKLVFNNFPDITVVSPLLKIENRFYQLKPNIGFVIIQPYGFIRLSRNFS